MLYCNNALLHLFRVEFHCFMFIKLAIVRLQTQKQSKIKSQH